MGILGAPFLHQITFDRIRKKNADSRDSVKHAHLPIQTILPPRPKGKQVQFWRIYQARTARPSPEPSRPRESVFCIDPTTTKARLKSALHRPATGFVTSQLASP